MGEVPRGGEYDETDEFRVELPRRGRHALHVPGRLAVRRRGPRSRPPRCSATASPAFPSHRGARRNGRVGVAVGDFGGNVYLIESSNGTFARRHDHDAQPHQLHRRHDRDRADSTSTAVPPLRALPPRLQRHHAATWCGASCRRARAAARSRTSTSTAASCTGTRSRGVEVVKQVPAGEADRYDDVDHGLTGPLAGLQHADGGLAAGRLLGRRLRDLRGVAALHATPRSTRPPTRACPASSPASASATSRRA